MASGCDFVVAQGTEAGGHTGQVATMALVPQVVDAVGDRVPVVAAGGLFDGRGLAAALALGADGVWIGTRFIATHEARAVAGYKETLLATAEDGTVVSRAYTGKTCRVVRNDWTQRFDDHPEELKPFPQQVVFAAEEGVNHLGCARRDRGRRAPGVLPLRPGRRRHRRAGARRRPGHPHGGRGRSGRSTASWPCGSDVDTTTILDDVGAVWSGDIVPTLHDYIAIPNALAGLRRRLGQQRPHDAGGRPRRRLVPRAARSPA